MKLPDWCLTMRCIDCESHAIVGNKIDCNYLNRLGLAQPTVKSFIDDTNVSPEKVDSQIADLDEQIKQMQEKKKTLDELKKERGGEEESASVS